MIKESVKDLNSRLRAVLATAVDGIITINPEGVIEFVNESTSNIFGYTPKEMVGNKINMLMPAPYREQHDHYIHNYQETGVKKIIGIGREVKGKRKDGTIFPFWLSVSEVALDGKRIFTGVVHDITEQKIAEEEIKRLNFELEAKVADRTERLSELLNKMLQTNQHLQNKEEELNRALMKEKELGELKSRFISMASHEFRTPLSTILSSASLMTEYKLAEEQDKREKHYRKIKNSVENLNTILNDFLSLSKLDEGKTINQPETFELPQFCNTIIEELHGLLKKGQIIHRIHNFIHGDIVQLDKKLLKTVLYNLLSNAIKYSPENATIECKMEKTDHELVIQITDQGIGIPEEDKPHMFDRFFRAHNSSHIQGTGLGLNIVKKHIEIMQGSISFESKESEGSTFTVKFKSK